MNIVTAVIVEGAIQQAKNDQELQKKYREHEIKGMLPHLRRMFHVLDTDGSGHVTLQELVDSSPQFRQDLQRCVNADSLVELFDVLDEDGSGAVDIDEFCDGIAKLSIHQQPIILYLILRQIRGLRSDLPALREGLLR